ncbi:MAG: hypothetical protein WDK95_06775 [Syntrophorhabdaceae bacterium]
MKVIYLDDLVDICGYFNGNTIVNNGYGCNHPDCTEKEIVKIDKDGEEHYTKEYIENTITKIALRKKYGSYQNIKKALETEEGLKYAKEIRKVKIFDNDFLKDYNCKLQGSCYARSCPVAIECDLQDLKKYDKALYEEWKNERYDPSETGASLMLIDDKEFK